MPEMGAHDSFGAVGGAEEDMAEFMGDGGGEDGGTIRIQLASGAADAGPGDAGVGTFAGERRQPDGIGGHAMEVVIDDFQV